MRPIDNRQTPDALDDIADLYSRNLGTYGTQSQSVGWKDAGSHRLRFEKLATVIQKDDAASGYTVNDFGCGYGAMFRFLDECVPAPLTHYWGYDISEAMIAAARSSVDDPRTSFSCAKEAIHEADYTFVCGTFNVRCESSDEAWYDYVTRCLEQLFRQSTKGLAFNLLSSYVDWKQDTLFYADPMALFDFCKRNLSPDVALLHDYPLYEWTMIVRRRD